MDNLPGHSRYAEAVADDEELAEDYLARTKGQEPSRRRHLRLSEWTPEREELRIVAERLATVASAVIAAAGSSKPLRFPDLPRPEVAVDRVRLRQRQAGHRQLVARLLPEQDPPSP